jgi:hypothetical protein
MINKEKGRRYLLHSLKGSAASVGKIGHKAAQCKSRQVKDDKNDVICNDC